MKRIIRLTEKDLTRIVKRVIKENEAPERYVIDVETGDMVGTHKYGVGFVVNKIGERMGYESDPTSIPNGTKMEKMDLGFDDDNDNYDDNYEDRDGFDKYSSNNFQSLRNIEEEMMMGDMYTDFGRKKIPNKSSEDISYDIQSVDCGGKNGMDGHVDIDEDNTIIIRYCEGDNEELDYLKKKGKGLLYMKYGMNPNDAVKMVDDESNMKKRFIPRY